MNQLFPPDDPSVGRIHDQLAHLAKIRSQMPAFGSIQVPTREQLSLLIEAAFWAGLRSDEGRTTRFRITVGTPQYVASFATPIPYSESEIAKLAHAAPQGGFLVVSWSDDGWRILGFGRGSHFADTVTIEVSMPGIVRIGVGPFQPYAVLDGRSNPIIAGTHIDLAAHFQRILRKSPPTADILDSQAVWRECLVLRVLARMITDDGHGGTVLIVPSENGAWSESLNSFGYRFATPNTTIRDGIRKELEEAQAKGELLQRLWQSVPDDLKNSILGVMTPRPWYYEQDVRAVASLAGVDGAIVMTRDMQVLGFGAKIATGAAGMMRAIAFQGGANEPSMHDCLESLGGTRHQSAARFVAANADAVAIVVSHDRHLSVMHWGQADEAVVVVRNVEWWV